MRHTKHHLSILAVALLLTACNKNISYPLSDNPDSTITANLPKTYTEAFTSTTQGNSTATYNLTWDSDKRLVLLALSTDPGTKMVYNYLNSKYSLDIFASGSLTIHEDFFLNGNSLVDSTFQYNDTHDSTTEKYFYNAAGQLVSMNEYQYSITTGGVLDDVYTYTYDDQGNQTKEVDYFSTQTYTWYDNDPYPFSLGNSYYPQPKHLLKGLALTTGGETETVSYTYTFDNKGRITTEKAIASNGDIIVKTYTY